MFNAQVSMFNIHVLNKVVAVQVCDATEDDKETKVDKIIIKK